MAVTALPRSQASTTRSGWSVHPAILLASLMAPALDLLALVQTSSIAPEVSLAWCVAAGVLLAATWLRHPREAWLAAAVLAVSASAALRVAGAPEAAVLSLLSVLALGAGGAFASPTLDLDAALNDVQV
jgi:hypothetical protein